MNKKLPSLFFLLFLTALINAQDTRWVRTIKGQGYDDCRDLYVDPRGNLYVTGQIEYTSSVSGYNLSSSGSHDIFVARFNGAGNLLWAKKAGGSSGDVAYSVAADTSGNVYLVGEIENTAHFDGISKTVQGSSNNMFIAKYDSSGNAVWVKNIGTNSGSTKGYAVACDPQGNVYACGTTEARAYLSGSTLFSSRGEEDIILIKFNTDGDYQWSKQIGGSDSDQGYGLAVKDQFIYVTGSYEGTAKFTSSFSLHSDGGMDFFLAQFDSTGTFNWAESGGGHGNDIGWDVTVNTNGQIVCTGEFSSSASFGNNSVSSSGSSDIFITAYDVNGDNIWANKAGGNDLDFGFKISNDYFGNLFVTGTFTDEAEFGLISLTGAGTEDIFLAAYDSSGNSINARAFGGPDHDRGQGIGADIYGNVFMAGEYWTEITFDSIYVPGISMYDGFLTRFGNYPVCSLSVSVTNPISCYNICDGEAVVYPSGLAPFQYEWPLLPQVTTGNVTGLCPGNYPVNVIDAYGCFSTLNVSLPNPSLLSINNSAIANATCLGCTDGSIDVTIVGGILPYSFLWSDGGITEDRTGLAAGNYTVCISDFNGCSFCDTFEILNFPNKIENVFENKLIEAYPNPVNTGAKIVFNLKPEVEKYQLEIYDAYGKLNESFPVLNNEMFLPMERYPDGVYILELREHESDKVAGLKMIVVSH